MMTRDYLTVLTVRSPYDARMTKRLFKATNGAIGRTGYDNGYTFDVQKIAIDNIADLAEIMLQLRSQPTKVVIRGRPTAGHYNVRRTLQTFEPDQHHWLFLDFDDVPLPLCIHPDDPEIALGYLVRLLPPAFHGASYYWQWSSGHAINRDSLRAHLFFWCDTKHTDKEYENWAKWINGVANEKILDPSVLRTVQPNYTAAPIIGKDVIDPVPPDMRCGIHMGEYDEVSMDIPTEKWEDHVRQQERDEYDELVGYGLRQPYIARGHPTGDRYLDFMGCIGDDRDGFHDPITRSIMYWAIDGTGEDEAFKDALRTVIRAAKCTKQRDLEHYLSDRYLDSSLRGAREKKLQPASPIDRIKNRVEWDKKRNQNLVEDDVEQSLEAIRRLCT